MRPYIRADDDPLAANEHDLHPARWASPLQLEKAALPASAIVTGKSSIGSSPTDCVGSSSLTPPGEQEIGVDAVALRHLRHGPARRAKLSATIRRFSPVDQKRR